MSFTASDFEVEALEPEKTYYYKLYIVLDDSGLEYSYQEGQPSFKTLGDTLNTLTVKAEKGGELLQNPSGSYVAGETISLSAQAGDGYVFSHWSSDLSNFYSGTFFENITSPSDCVLNMPNTPITVTACFKADVPAPSHYISFVSDPGGMLLQGTNGWYEENEPVAIAAEAGEDSSFIEWISTNGTFENAYAPATVFYPTAADAEVRACFGPKPTKVTASTNSIDLGQVSQVQVIFAYEYVYLTNNGDYPVSIVLESSESFTLTEGKGYLAPGEEGRYMAAVRNPCQPGVYQETLYFKTHEGDVLAEVEMSVEITAASGAYTVQTGPFDVGDFGTWYTNITLPEPRTVTVQYLGDGTVELGQPYLDEYAKYFTIGPIGKKTLASNETTTFTIQPNADIPPGMYSASCKVPAYSAELDADLEAGFAVTMNIYHGAVAASPQEVQLPKHYTEAETVEPVVVSFTNIGNTTLYQEIEQPELKYFTVNAVGYSEWPMLWSKQAGRSFLVSVAPKTDLEAGEYSETLSLPFTTENNSVLVETVTLKVKVEEESGEDPVEPELEFEGAVSPAESMTAGRAESICVTIRSGQTQLTEANFVSLSLDGQYLEAGDEFCVSENGRLQIELSADYLNTLPVGNYEVDVAFTGETSSVYHYTFTLSVYEREMSYLILPKSLTAIGTEAFVGNQSDGAVLPNTVVSIGSRAFADCENLMLINIPGSVEYIADDAFDGCTEELRMIVDRGSLGHEYAEAHGYPCYVRNPQ